MLFLTITFAVLVIAQAVALWSALDTIEVLTPQADDAETARYRAEFDLDVARARIASLLSEQDARGAELEAEYDARPRFTSRGIEIQPLGDCACGTALIGEDSLSSFCPKCPKGFFEDHAELERKFEAARERRTLGEDLPF